MTEIGYILIAVSPFQFFLCELCHQLAMLLNDLDRIFSGLFTLLQTRSSDDIPKVNNAIQLQGPIQGGAAAPPFFEQ